jgi:ribosomal protein S17
MDKMPSDSETKNISIARKSIHLKRIYQRAFISEEDIIFYDQEMEFLNGMGKYCR